MRSTAVCSPCCASSIILWHHSMLKEGLPVQPHITPVVHTAVCESYNHRRAVSLSSDGVARVWNTESGRVTNTFSLGHGTTVGLQMTLKGAGVITAAQLGMQLWLLPAATMTPDAAAVAVAAGSDATGVNVKSQMLTTDPVASWSLSPDKGTVAYVNMDRTKPIKVRSCREVFVAALWCGAHCVSGRVLSMPVCV
jgi:hypothetical protein